MIIGNFLRNRRSVREFRERKVDYEILDEINNDLRLTENEIETGNIRFKLYENGENVSLSLKGKGGYAGVMINSPHYITLIRTDDNTETIIKSGYYMEKLVTILNNKGLSTCWVSIGNIDANLKKKVFGDFEGKIDYLLAFGYEKRRNPFNTEPYSERIGVEQYIFDGKIGRESSTNTLELMGLMDIFYYLRFAPSTKNLQPWRFVIKDEKIELFLAYKEWDKLFLVDAGIIMYYFEILADYQGIRNQWKLVEGQKEDIKFDGYNHKLIGEYDL